MNKLNSLLLAIVALLLVASVASAAEASTAPTCAEHPGWIKVKEQLKNWSASETKVKEVVEAVFAQFEATIPEAQDTESLGKCSQYDGQLSCCRSEITGFLNKIVHLKVKPLTKKENITRKLLRFAVNKLKNKDCVAAEGKTKPTKVEDISALLDTAFPLLKDLLEKSKTCKAEYHKVVSAFARGAACSVCAGTDKIEQYYTKEGNIQITQTSVDEFLAAVALSTNCLNDLLTKEKVVAAIEEVVKYYLAVDNKCIASIMKKAENFAGKGKAGNCSAKNVFNDNSKCNESQEGDSDLDAETTEDAAPVATRLLRQNSVLRNLAGSGDDATVSSTGVNVFITSDVDSQLTAEGDINLDDIDSSSSSVLVASFAVAITLMAALF